MGRKKQQTRQLTGRYKYTTEYVIRQDNQVMVFNSKDEEYFNHKYKVLDIINFVENYPTDYVKEIPDTQSKKFNKIYKEVTDKEYWIYMGDILSTVLESYSKDEIKYMVLNGVPCIGFYEIIEGQNFINIISSVNNIPNDIIEKIDKTKIERIKDLKYSFETVIID